VDELKINVFYDPEAKEYTFASEQGITIRVGEIELPPRGGLFATVRPSRDGLGLPFERLDLLKAYPRLQFARAIAASNGADPGIYTAHLNHIADYLGTKVRDVKSASATGQVAEGEWPEPLPIPDSLPPVPPFDLALLPTAFQDYVKDIAERMQCPPDFPAVSVMLCAAAAVGRQVGIRPKRFDDWLVVPNLWGAVIGRPGILKSPAILEPLKQIQYLEVEGLENYQHAIKKYHAEEALAEAKRKQARKDIEKQLRDGNTIGAEQTARSLASLEIAEPIRQRYLTNDTTIEKLGELLAENPRGMLVFRDELVGFLRSLDREGREGSRAFFLEAWNGTGRFTYDRIGRGTLDIEAACVSILGGIQPGPLQAYVGGALKHGADDDGLLQRFQLLVWPDISGEWRNVDRWPDTNTRQAVCGLLAHLANLPTEAIGAKGDSCGDIPSLRFDEPAYEVFTSWREQLEYRLRNSEYHPAFEAHLSKYRSLAPTLALLCHLADLDYEANTRPMQVGIEPTLRALAWCEYLEKHAQRVYAAILDPCLAAARELARHMRAEDLPTVFTAREVYLKGWRLLDGDGTQKALEYLEEMGYVRSERRETGGRPQTLWHINPALKENSNH
jgi:putative DNA primase/helicase